MNLGKYHFNDLAENEKIVKIIHRHWFDVLQQFFISFVLIGALILGFIIMPSFFQFENSEEYKILLFIESGAAIFIWIYMFLIWIDYYLDVWVITTERIINIEQKGLFVRHVSELKLVKIQDVTTEVEGFLPTLLNYGDVHIQTAADQVRFIFRSVPDPYHIKSEIMKRHKESQKKNIRQLGNMIREGKLEL